MRLIDADALELDGWSLCRNYQQDKNTMVYESKSIAEIPTAQPEIIRCKDCKYSSPNKVYGCRIHSFADDLDERMYSDDFCSRAERRNDGKIH